MTYVLFSSGLDSWCCLHEAILRCGVDNVRAIYFDMGQCYAQKEIAAAHELCNAVGVQLIIREDLNGLLCENRNTAEMPLRNLFLIMAIAAIPNARAVVFGMLKNEQPVDKNPKFVKRVQTLLDSQTGGRFTIITPYADFTKTKMLGHALKHYKWPVFSEMLPITIGCHNATKEPCGECIACFNRWVAFTLNDVVIPVSSRPEPVAEWMLYILRQRSFKRGIWRGFMDAIGECRVTRMFAPWMALELYTTVVYNMGLRRYIKRGTR